jgi:hypothetical protein
MGVTGVLGAGGECEEDGAEQCVDRVFEFLSLRRSYAEVGLLL